ISKTPYRIDNLIWSLANVCSKASKTKSTAPDSGKECQKTQHSNLIRYVPSGTYFARLRVRGKLIRKSCRVVFKSGILCAINSGQGKLVKRRCSVGGSLVGLLDFGRGGGNSCRRPGAGRE